MVLFIRYSFAAIPGSKKREDFLVGSRNAAAFTSDGIRKVLSFRYRPAFFRSI